MKISAKLPPRYEGVLDPVNIGDIAEDGSIYLGYYGGKDWYTTAEDAKSPQGTRLVMDFNAAARYAINLKSHGHDDWRLPPGTWDKGEPDILSMMFNYRNVGAFKGTYDQSGSSRYSWYWGSTKHETSPDSAWEFGFESGGRGWAPKRDEVAVRCVRAVAR